MKNSEQNFLPLHLAAPCKNLPVSMTLSCSSFLTASKPSRRLITAAKTKEKRIPKIDFYACPSHNVVKVKRDAGGNKGKLLCCKRIFDRIKANLAEIQRKNHQNVEKNAFFAKRARSQWVNYPLLKRVHWNI